MQYGKFNWEGQRERELPVHEAIKHLVPKRQIAEQTLAMESQDRIGEIGTRWKVGYAFSCIAVVASFDAFSQLDRGLIAGFSFAVIVLLARIRWDLRSHCWFWIFLVVCVLFHSIAVAAFNGRIGVHPTILLAPFVTGDFAILVLLLFLLERSMKHLFER